MLSVAAAVIALAAIGSLAHADPDVERRLAPIAPYVNTGIEILGGANSWSYASRTHVGLDIAWGAGRIRPSIGGGGTFGLGTLEVPDPRALSGRVAIGYYEVGPELRLGLRWVDGGIVDSQVFASFAYLCTDLDARLMLDSVDGVAGDRGMRAALGFNWV